MEQSLYERLGGTEGIERIAHDTVENHLKNPRIVSRYVNSDLDMAKRNLADFVITGTGGPEVYKGREMVPTHKGMNISDNEFMAAVDDVMLALTQSNIGDREKGEMLFILYSLRPQVVGI